MDNGLNDMSLTQQDIDRISEAVTKRLESTAFMIPAEDHYLQHQELSELLKLLNSGRNFIVKGLAGLFAIGAIAVILMGAKTGHWNP
jgi:hypothetical protein